MAICTSCAQDMLAASSCTVEKLHLGGVMIPLLRYGREPRYRSRRPVRCADCGVTAGGYHHSGCDVADCPSCKSRLLGCACPYDERGAVSEGSAAADSAVDRSA